MNVIDEYYEEINGQRVLVKVIHPEEYTDFKWEYAHEMCSFPPTNFKPVLGDIDGYE